MFETDLKNSLCRTCLTTLIHTEKCNIFDIVDLAKKLMLCSSLPVEAADEYPSNICLQCYKQILLFYEFQQMCCKSLEKLNELLVANKEDTKENDPLSEEINLISIEKNEPKNVSANTIKNFAVKKRRGRLPIKKIEGENKETNISPEKLYKNVPPTIRHEAVISLQNPLEFNNTTEYKLDECNSENNYHQERDGEEAKLKTSVNKRKCNRGDVEETDIHSNLEIEKKSFSELDSNICTKKSKLAQNRNYQCDRCDKRFNATLHLEAHKKQHDGLPPYTCNYEGCDRSFNRWHFYNKHQKDHKSGKEHTFRCDVDNCERVYKNKSALNIHKRKYHKFGPELKTHMCEICGKVFKSSAVLNDHHYTHIDRTQLPYACEEEGCSKRFSNKEKLKVHKMRHAGIKNFICPYCGMRKTTRNELKIHVNYHTLERTWPCRFCPKVCNSAGNLKMHIKNMHERAKDFACRFCERTFAKADTKKYHEMTHTGEKPHECKECGRRFVQPAALRTHRKVHLKQKTNLIEGQKEEMAEVQVNNMIEVIETTIITEDMVTDILIDNNTNID